MPTYSKKPKSQYEPAPQGTHLARVFQFIHIGTIDGEYQGKPRKFDKIRLSFELPTKTKVFKEGEPAKPIVVHQEYTTSMGAKSNLRKIVEGIIGTSLTDDEAYAFDIESLVGMPCIVTIKHKTSAMGNVRAEIASAASLMEGQVCPPQFNKSVVLSYSSWSQEVFDNLPDFLKEMMEKSEEYRNKFARLTGADADRVNQVRDSMKRQSDGFDEDENEGADDDELGVVDLDK